MLKRLDRPGTRLFILIFINPHSTKKPHRDSEHEAMDDSIDQSTNLNQSLDQAGPCSQSDQGEEELGQSHDPQDADDEEEEGRLVIAQDVDEEPAANAVNSTQRSPPPLIKHFSTSRYINVQQNLSITQTRCPLSVLIKRGVLWFCFASTALPHVQYTD